MGKSKDDEPVDMKGFKLPPAIGYEDMTQMDDMTLEGVLSNLKDRYAGDLIYTYTSSILVAINPFKRLPIYDKKWVKMYKGKRIGLISPHIYAIADATYTCMIEHKVNQSVLVSGESGAGKTESTKLILAFLSARTDRASPIETMVLESIPVLEALGNAKTGRNDNSSRFGKFIEIQFDDDYYIAGSKIIPYLLEKSRIVYPHEGERNYHIFYQMTVGMDDAEKKKYHLTKPKDYRYLNCSSCISIKGMDEAEELASFKRALGLFEVSPQIQDDMLKVLASVLHLGNVMWKPDGDKATIKDDKSNQHLAWAAELLSLDVEKLRFSLTHKLIKMRDETIEKPLNHELVRGQTDAFAKYVYSTLFDWMVNKLNECTCAEQFRQFIGVLDIFGFEKFDLNSLEQFLINLANEKLQQFFNHHIFKLEQKIYEEEQIDWSVIEFKDNQKCLDLIEKRRPPGILSILDEETKFPRATDETLIEKLHQNFDKKSEYYEKPRLKKVHFTVNHYAGGVEYDIVGWREKNRDEVPEMLSNLIKKSDNKFIALLYTESVAADPSGKMTVGAQFKQQLTDLMALLTQTEPYFIRCVKPNEDKLPDKFDEQLIHDQLLYAGMMETIAIRRMGYPVRYALDDFWKRYKVICPEVSLVRGDMTKTLNTLISALGLSIPGDTQIGKTKVFLKQDIANDLEDRRNVALTSTILKMQVWWRCVSARSRFCDSRKSSLKLQAWWRSGFRRKAFVAQHHKSIVLQSWYRMVMAMKRRKVLLEKKRKEDAKKPKKPKDEGLTDKEREKLRQIAAGELKISTEEAEAEEAARLKAEEKAAKKRAKMERTKSIMMKKGEQVEIPINVDGKITIGLGWKGGQWDMDASVLCFRYAEHRDDVYYYKPRSRDGGIVHRSGYAGFIRIKDGEDKDVEQIDINLTKVSPKTNTLVFVVTVFSEESNFSSIQDPYVRLVDTSTDNEFCRYNIEQSGSETAKIMCKLYRLGFSRWRLKAIGEPADGRLYKHMITQVRPYLQEAPPKRRFKVKLHRAKLKDMKAQYTGEESALSTFCEIRYDIDKAKSRVVKKSMTPQYKTARDVAGQGAVMEVIVKSYVRFGKEQTLARALIPLEAGTNIQEQWVKLEGLEKGRARGQTTVQGDLKISITETTPGVNLKAPGECNLTLDDSDVLNAPPKVGTDKKDKKDKSGGEKKKKKKK
eukprot:TRINITY_DN454_c0_g3_i1.p1 TRINITY_DN454_c0_g3~~TRINITY_DN454_c0_g3_i1.p1  ORF type:complete len:1201 (+),score=643.11 TRINITY_DN454_c0_g3_i1:33-3605(+)